MDDHSADTERYIALLEKMLLDAGIELPDDPYAGLYGDELKAHQKRMRERSWAKTWERLRRAEPDRT